MQQSPALRLGVNIDHVATVRNARGGAHPDPVAAALIAEQAGAHGITAHLREDRRHIRDDDIQRLKAQLKVPLNFEMAATDEMLQIAERTRPNACCLVPERREEVTTEGGLDLEGKHNQLIDKVSWIKGFEARVSLFVDPSVEAMEAAAQLGADIVELHTGELAHAYEDDPQGDQFARQLERLEVAARRGDELGLEVHAGHGLNFETAEMVAAIPQLHELNIGHFLMGEAMMYGLAPVVSKMLLAMDRGVARRPASLH